MRRITDGNLLEVSSLGQPVLIVGMHRSGTSAMAQVLSKLGVFFGDPQDLHGADYANADGYFEHKRIQKIIRKFELSLSLSNLGVDPLPAEWTNYPFTGNLTSQLDDALIESFEGHKCFGYKDPDCSWLLPFFDTAIGDQAPFTIICVRDPREVADSQLKRNGAPVAATLATWIGSTLTAIHDSRFGLRAVVMYQDLLENPEKTISRLLRDMDFLDPTAHQVADAVASINPRLRHNTEQLDTDDDPTGLTKDIMDLCRRVSTHTDGFIHGAYNSETTALLQRADQLSAMYSPSLPVGHASFSWPRSGEATVTFHPCRCWQTLSFPIDAPPGTEVVGHLYGLPAEIWIRKSVWKTATKQRHVPVQAGRHATLAGHENFTCLLNSAGPDQLKFTVPNEKGPATLELEILVQCSNLITATHSQTLLGALGL